MKDRFRITVATLALCVVSAGCTVNIASDQKGMGTTTERAEANTSEASSSSVASPSPELSSRDIPSGYTLEESCTSGTGKTGKTIYYLPPSSGSRRFACVHKVGSSPNISFGDYFYKNLADISGNHCAFSKANMNVGCALEPITEDDLMGPQPPSVSQTGVPAGYVLEDCQSVVGATGKTIYFRPPEQGGAYGTAWFECVHPQGATGYVNAGSTEVLKKIIAQNSGGYCAFSTADNNIGCALEPITSKDLMNPS